MGIEKVRNYFATYGMAERVMEFSSSSATVTEAAQTLHTQECRIAKTLSFRAGEKPILIVTAGDMKVDNPKYRLKFGVKAKMIPLEAVEDIIGFAAGGVCPFAVNEGVEVYLDVSLKRFTTVFPACGSGNSAIELTVPELEKYSHFVEWVDVCRAKEQ